MLLFPSHNMYVIILIKVHMSGKACHLQGVFIYTIIGSKVTGLNEILLMNLSMWQAMRKNIFSPTSLCGSPSHHQHLKPDTSITEP